MSCMTGVYLCTQGCESRERVALAGRCSRRRKTQRAHPIATHSRHHILVAGVHWAHAAPNANATLGTPADGGGKAYQRIASSCIDYGRGVLGEWVLGDLGYHCNVDLKPFAGHLRGGGSAVQWADGGGLRLRSQSWGVELNTIAISRDVTTAPTVGDSCLGRALARQCCTMVLAACSGHGWGSLRIASAASHRSVLYFSRPRGVGRGGTAELCKPARAELRTHTRSASQSLIKRGLCRTSVC